MYIAKLAVAVVAVAFAPHVAGSKYKKSCSAKDSAKGYATMAIFTACSGLSASDIQAMSTQITKDKALQSKLKAKAKLCSQKEGEERLQCLATFMSTLSYDGILTADEGSDDSSVEDLVTTCGCLSTALENMPNCGIFAEFYNIGDILQTSRGVCADISSVCDEIGDFSKLCLDANIRFKFSSKTCAQVPAQTDECDSGAHMFWLAGTGGAEYCGLKKWQVTKPHFREPHFPPGVGLACRTRVGAMLPL